jgi:hypothetical protein
MVLGEVYGVFNSSFWIGDRQFTAYDLALIRAIASEFGWLNRRELAATVCENLSWKAPNRHLKVNGCRLLLERDERRRADPLAPEEKAC